MRVSSFATPRTDSLLRVDAAVSYRGCILIPLHQSAVGCWLSGVGCWVLLVVGRRSAFPGRNYWFLGFGRFPSKWVSLVKRDLA